jgi:hypothetical protein
MKYKKRIVIILLLLIVLTVGFCIIRTNTLTPVGAIRYECLLHGHIFSAIFLQVEEVKTEADGIARVYKVTFAVPYEKATATHLDYWNVIKNKNGTYSASYGVA